MAKAIFGKKVVALFLAGAMTASLAACSGNTDGQIGEAKINIEPYSKTEFNTEKVQSGDIQSSLSLELKPDGYTSKNYSIEQSDYKVQDINVKEGDKVKKGDVMIQFEAKDIQKTIEAYTDQKEQAQLSVDHYTRLAAIDSGQDYSSDIASAKQEIEIANTYIEEQNEQMKAYQVIAEQDGTVTYVNADLQYGYATPKTTLVTVDSGSSNYVAETEDSYEFTEGKVYTASFEEAEFDMKLVSCERYTSTATGLEMQTVTFEPVDDMAGVTEADTLEMIIEKPVVKNVVYVNKKAVFDGADSNKYVYVVDENGYRSAVEVTVGDTVDDYTVIKTGLEAGEQVVIN